ncbi:MAG: serine/threonine-protein kinase [Myxococcaceae bacterium]
MASDNLSISSRDTGAFAAVGRDPREVTCALDQELPPGSDPLAGTQIGPYEVHGSLIQGNPRTLLAFNLDSQSTAGLALLRKIDGDTSNSRLASSLVHPNLEHTLGVEGGYWVSELVEGATLLEVRVASKQARIPLPMGFALAAIHQAAKGLQKIHVAADSFGGPRKNAHGLIRPQNIVMGFGGKAVLLNPQYLPFPNRYSVDTQPLLGNAGYLSPEAVRGEQLTSRSDVFSLGVLAHEAATDRPLFRGTTAEERARAVLKGEIPPPSRANLSLNAQVDEVILKALSFNPDDRYPNAEAFAQAFYAAAGPFMAREAQRADLMQRLFVYRPQRLQALTDLLRERQSVALALAADKRREEEEAVRTRQAADAEAAERATVEQKALDLAEEQAQAATIVARAVVPPVAAPAPRSTLQQILALPKVVLGGAAALVLLLFLLLGVLLFKPKPPPPPPPPPAPKKIWLPMPPPPALKPRAPTPPVAEEAPAEKTAPVKKKKKKDDVALPPWLR